MWQGTHAEVVAWTAAHWMTTAHNKSDGTQEGKPDRRAKGGVRKLEAGAEPTWLCPHTDCDEQCGLSGSLPREKRGDCAIRRHDRAVHGTQCPKEARMVKTKTLQENYQLMRQQVQSYADGGRYDQLFLQRE